MKRCDITYEEDEVNDDARQELRRLAETAWCDHLFGVRGTSSMIDWGVACLLAGIDSQTIAEVAAMDGEDQREVASRFRRGAAELGVDLPERGGAAVLPWLEQFFCREIITGRIDERVGLAHLYDLWLEAGMGECFRNWMYLQDSIELLASGYRGTGPFSDLAEEKIPAAIRAEASRVAAAAASEVFRNRGSCAT